MSSSFPIIFTITLSLFTARAALSDQVRNCVSLYVEVQQFGESNIDRDNWNGLYLLDSSQQSFNASVWQISDNKWLKYIESYWVLSGENRELLIYESNILFPPTNTSSTWIHEFHTNSASILLYCSSSLSPTAAPTPAPTALPTFSPTPKQCDVLVVSDETHHKYFNDWLYERLPDNDYNGRPMWQYAKNNIESNVLHLPHGWTVFFNNGTYISTYASTHLHGYYPPLNIYHWFNISSDGLHRHFLFECLSTNHPTAAPSSSPTAKPTSAPTQTPTAAPSISPVGGETVSPSFVPTSIPTIAPSAECQVLRIGFEDDDNIHDTLHENAAANNDDVCDIALDAVFGETYWLQQQVSRSNRPSYTLDCDDYNSDYTSACLNGYSGSIFYISDQWEIQIHRKSDACLERFIVSNTASHFVPMTAFWMRESTQHEYEFTMECFDKIDMEPDSTADTLIREQTIFVYVQETWFWISFVLLIVICCLLCVGCYYWKKKQKPVVVYEPKNVKSISAFSPSSVVELGAVPQVAYADHYADVALQDGRVEFDEHEGISGHESDSKSDLMLETETAVTNDGFAGTASDPRMNPNLKANVMDGVTGTANDPKVNPNLKKKDGDVATANDPKVNPNLKPNVAEGAKRSGSSANVRQVSIDARSAVSLEESGDSDHENDDLWDNIKKRNERSRTDDKALDVIAGDKKFISPGYDIVDNKEEEDGDGESDENEEFIVGV